MSWMHKLYRTYDAIVSKGLDTGNEPLTPMGHTLQTAHIEIVLDGQGNFQTASVMPPKTTIMLPVTEKSENRTSGEEPHPFADKLQYVAKDYLQYGGDKKPYFESYLKQLQAWCDSPYAHSKVQAVLDYVKKGRVMADLIEAGVFTLHSDGHIVTKWEEGNPPPIFSCLTKTKGEIETGSALVCWTVETADDINSQTWTDETIQQSWIDYLSVCATDKGFCSVKGEEMVLTGLHPAKLRHTGDKAKLISANDNSGYTFRGRFDTSAEAASISAEVSAKAHSALRWLISRQKEGRNGDQVTVAWVLSGQTVPSPLRDNYQYIDEDDDLEFVAEENRPSENIPSSLDYSGNLGLAAAAKIKKKMHGFKTELKDHEQISLLMLDSATPGRMALTYYQEFLPADYFEHLDAWIDDFSWYQRYTQVVEKGKKATRVIWPDCPPSPKTMADAIYGAASSDALRKQFYARLLPVIAGGKKAQIPEEWLNKSFQMACNPNGSEHWEWERNIGVACALYKGYRARHHDSTKRRNYTMALDKENNSRDYLYGRLLAIAENIESYALYLAGEKRSTTAERYMQRFAEHPFVTWRNIELALRPYQERLHSRNKNTGRQAIGEIMDLFKNEDFIRDDKLSGEFLLGYHCQKMALAREVAEYSNNKDAKKNQEAAE